jgi:hypothetical protein
MSEAQTTDTSESWMPDERALLAAALDFYGAAESVIDYAGADRPRLRYEVGGLQGVRDAMGALEERVRLAHDAGVSPERIARITRLEPEIVDLILARHRATVRSATQR